MGGGAENKIELAKMGIEIILFLKFTEKMLLYQFIKAKIFLIICMGSFLVFNKFNMGIICSNFKLTQLSRRF